MDCKLQAELSHCILVQRGRGPVKKVFNPSGSFLSFWIAVLCGANTAE